MLHKIEGEELKCTAFNTAGVHKLLLILKVDPYFEISPTHGPSLMKLAKYSQLTGKRRN